MTEKEEEGEKQEKSKAEQARRLDLRLLYHMTHGN